MLIALAGLVLAFVLIVLFSNRATRSCRWRARGGKEAGCAVRFECVTCGASAQSDDGAPPRRCLRPRRPPSL